MELPEKVREVTSSGVEAQTAFQISLAHQAHIKSILRDNIYSDKILAILREYAANAWDAHRMVGKFDLPIEIHIPEYADMNFIVKDFGPGLSHDDVFNIFTQYGNSTKRNTNDAVGMLGIGSKSGFAYSDTFTIISRHGGKARTYVAMLDEADNDALTLLNEADCGDDTGLTIQIAARKEDIHNFQVKAAELYQHFTPRPKINILLPAEKPIRSKLKHGIIFDKNRWDEKKGVWHAVMGCIPYKVDLTQLVDASGTRLISEGMLVANGLLTFDIGELQVNASREGLKYSNITKDALVKKFELVLEDFVKVVLDEIENTPGSGWNKRLKAQTLLSIGLARKETGDWGTAHVNLDQKTFNCHAITVSEGARIVLARNMGDRKLGNYTIQRDCDFVVTPANILSDQKDAWGQFLPKRDKNGAYEQYSWDEIMKELEEKIKEHNIDGIPIVEIGVLPYYKPYWQQEDERRKQARANRAIDPKHSAKVFQVIDIPENRIVDKASDRWEVIKKRTPTPDDAFVVLSHFEVLRNPRVGGSNDWGNDFWYRRQEDIRIAKTLGVKLPPVYGYKTGDKKPVEIDKVVGMHYPDWRKNWLKNLPKAAVNKFRDEQAWQVIRRLHGLPNDVLGRLVMSMGRDHEITKFFRKVYRETKFKRYQDRSLTLMIALNIFKLSESPAYEEYAALCLKYPILGKVGFQYLGSKTPQERKDFQKYVQLLNAEQAIPVTSTVTTTPVEPVSSTPEVQQS